jgi:PAS domain S-box-containing protein
MRREAPRANSANVRQSLAIALAIAALLCLALPLRWLDPLEARLLDLRFALRGERAPSGSVVLVTIDDDTVRRYPSLPSDPQLHAELIRRLSAAGVAAIGLDIPELARPALDATTAPDGGVEPYRDLTAALSASGRAVLPMVWVRGEKGAERGVPAPVSRFAVGKGRLTKPVELLHPQMLYPRADLCAAAAGVGALNVYPDRDWTVRQAPLLLETDGLLYPSLALEMARVASHRQVRVTEAGGTLAIEVGSARFRANGAGEILINFAGPADTYPTVPYADLLEGDKAPADLAAALRGKLVLVGSTAVGEQSRLRTPYSPFMTGVELTANVLDTLIAGRRISQPRTREGIPLTILVAALAAALSLRLRPRRAVLSVGLLAVGVFGASSFAFAARVCLPTAGPLLAALLVGTILSSRRAVAAYMARERESDRTRQRMEALAGVGRLLNSGLNRQQLLTEIMVWVEAEIGCEASSLVLRSEETGRLGFEVALGPKAEAIKDVEVEVGHGIVGTVVATGEPLVVPETEGEPRFAREIASAVGFPARSILCVPLTVRRQVIGAIEVINKRDGTLFSQNDVALLTVIAQHAAMFLETARLYGVLERRVDLANEELRLANRQLSAEKAKLEAIVHHMADGIVAADEHGRIALINRAAEEMLGVAEERLFGAPAASALPNEDLAALFAARPDELPAARELALGDPVQRIIRAHPALAVDEQGVAGRVVVMADITDLRELDRTKTDMVSFVSHELKTPLAAIKGFAGILRDRAAEADSRGFADIINRQAERMYGLIDDFLNIARIDMGRDLEIRWQRIEDVRPIIREAISLQPLAGPQHRFIVDVPSDLPPLQADPDKLYHILLNLINNAVKYSPDGGPIEISVSAEDARPGLGDFGDAHWCPAGAGPGGKWLHFTVRDEGLGIHPENMPHLFRRFRRVTDGSGERVEGTGLGLFLTRHLVQAHGGEVWAESEPRKGSTFHFVLPMEGRPDDERSPEDQPGRPGPPEEASPLRLP